jgi:hypothetical protein
MKEKSLLLVGARSYVLDSVRRVCEIQGLRTQSFGSEMSSEVSGYTSLPRIAEAQDKVLIVATPGDFRSREPMENYSPNPRVLEFIRENSSDVVCLSTVRVSDYSPAQQAYANRNLEFENIALELGARVLRLPNYWGFYPSARSSQLNLAPWVFLRNAPAWATFPERKIPFVTPIDLLEKVDTSWFGAAQLEPSFEMSPQDIKDLQRKAKGSLSEKQWSPTDSGFLKSPIEFAVYTLVEDEIRKLGPDVSHAG